MLQKFAKIKNMGVYHNYTWDTALADFTKKNIIYGRNGSGKSTLARLLQMLELKEDIKYEDSSVLFPNLEFEIVGNGIQLKHGNYKSNTLKIKVFNKEFVDKNIFAKGGPQPIIWLDTKDISLVQEKDRLEQELLVDEPKLVTLGRLTLQSDSLLKAGYKDVGDKIRAGLLVVGNYKNYDSSNVKTKYSDKSLTLSVLSEADLDKSMKFINQSAMQDVDSNIEYKTIDTHTLLSELNTLLGQQVVNAMIDELKGNKNAEDWVKNGIGIHKGKTKCYFCDNDITQQRLDQIAEHFNDSFLKLESSIDGFITKVQGYIANIEAISLPSKGLLYEDLQQEFEDKIELFNKLRKESIIQFKQFQATATEKKSKMNQVLKYDQTHIDNAQQVDECIKAIKSIIEQHNTRNADFQNQKQSNAESVELHYLAEGKVEIEKLTKDYEKKKEDEKDLKDAITTKKARITAIQAILKNHAKAADMINGYLEILFGRKEIQLIPTASGYILDRNGDKKFAPSEGEKTAIALAYFLTTLDEDGFDICNSIVAIDDPVSSLDDNVLFSAYSLILSKLKDCYQLFLFTHHYGLLKLVLKEWTNGNAFKTNCSGYFISSFLEAGNRRSKIGLFDEMLIKYESEYQFLFKQLKDFVADPSMTTFEETYPYANYSRKLLEGFLAFKFPKQPNLRQKLEEACKKAKIKTPTLTHSEEEIYRFINIFSHNDSISSFKDVDLTIFTNGKKIIKDIFDVIKAVDPDHFDAMNEICA